MSKIAVEIASALRAISLAVLFPWVCMKRRRDVFATREWIIKYTSNRALIRADKIHYESQKKSEHYHR